MSPGKKLEAARDDLRTCNESIIRKRLFGCQKSREAYENAKNEFLKPFQKIEEEGEKYSNDLSRESSDKRLLGYAAEKFIKALNTQNYFDYRQKPFEQSRLSLDDYAYNIFGCCLDCIDSAQGGLYSSTASSVSVYVEMRRADQKIKDLVDQQSR